MNRVSIINKYGVEGNAITGKSAKELADYLHENGVNVRMISIDAHYKGKKASKIDGIKVPYHTITIKNLYSGKRKIFRLIFNLVDGFRLILVSLKRKDDVKIVMTDPSLINLCAIIAKPLYRSKIVFWTMDLYPDAFTAAGLVESDNIVFRLMNHFIYKNPPNYLIALGKMQRRYFEEKYKRHIDGTILPCGITECVQSVDEPQWRKDNRDKIIFCYAGNIGEAHDCDFLIEFAKLIDPEKHLLLLALYGAKADIVISSLQGKKAILLLDYVNYDELSFVDVNIASLVHSWNHVCVPSKVVSAICAKTPVLYNASVDSEAYNMFGDALWLIPQSKEYKTHIKRFIDQLTLDTINRKRESAANYSTKLQELRNKAMNDILQYCKSI